LIVATHTDFRLDLPRPVPMHEAPSSAFTSWFGTFEILAGFASAPDQPPELFS